MFRLNEDKIVISDLGDRKIKKTFVTAGEYPIIRIFDNDRVLVDLNSKKKKRNITLLRINEGGLLEILEEKYEPDK